MPKLEKIRFTAIFEDVSPTELYDTWMSSKGHAAMNGAGKCTIDPVVGGRHVEGDGYMHGWNLALSRGKRIVQSWRTTDFAPESPDSVIELTFAKTKDGTALTLLHTDIPEGQGEGYSRGWPEFYFDPMALYFAKGGVKKAPAKATKKAAAKPAKKAAAKKPAAKKATTPKSAKKK